MKPGEKRPRTWRGGGLGKGAPVTPVAVVVVVENANNTLPAHRLMHSTC